MAKRQAVLLIHGVGEQRPMDTLRGFAEAVWSTYADIHNKYAGTSLWSKPDSVSRSFELRRLTTPQNTAGVETHFYEFYWAHLMKGTKYGHVWAWARSLLLRWPTSVPKHLFWVYIFIWLLILAGGALMAYFGWCMTEDKSGVPTWVAFGASLATPIAAFFVLKVIGDAARYLHIAPENIQSRHEIRQMGVDLLKELHDPSRRYDRIIVVGHSLGSVIGYDILTHAWIKFHERHAQGANAMAALDQLEELSRDPRADPDKIPAAQRAYFEEMKANGNLWRVTDFITLGSPLAHAEILLAKDGPDLRQKQADREFPRCPPELEDVRRGNEMVRRVGYESIQGNNESLRIPHHAAVFGPTRWTNLYMPESFMLWGDLIGGPVRPVMGPGVRDIAVSTSVRGGFLAHTEYWTLPGDGTLPESVTELRKALDLTDGPVKAE
ncbi:hypothetical protein [Usitatibacter palustris]|uniref:Uncharacterized protein n=1 Tax=Usitatibacter palustris TaxID=2732487 RepID=A0A6M4H8G8_9PROT|nr:hypothetical protein [Usitatibacter palustris]QJR15906.1 hypothetical protein DSM104440_02732 [Usitatibacter palustris]